jgi:hypothetical protein
MKRSMIVALVGLMGAAAGCDSDSTGPDETLGTYEMTLTGDMTETAEGPASFGTDVDDDGDPIFGLLFGDEESRHVVIAGKAGSARPAVGTYDIAEGAWELLHMISDDEELVGLLFGVEGEINITRSSSTRLSGTIDFVATGYLDEDEVEFEGSISFDAVRATPTNALSLSAARSLR